MTTFIVAVYKTGKAYGGPEEGGWWYYCGEHVRTVRVFKNGRQRHRFLSAHEPSSWRNLEQGQARAWFRAV